MITSYDIIKTIVRTEKGTDLEEAGKYIFQVAIKANKIQVRRAVEEIYNVKVRDVNTMKVRGKKKRVRREEGRTSAWKKAIVTLKKGEKIETT